MIGNATPATVHRFQMPHEISDAKLHSEFITAIRSNMKRIPASSSKHIWTLLLSGIATAALAGCGGEKFAGSSNGATGTGANGVTVAAKEEPPSKPGKYGGTLTEASISDPKTFNLWVAAETSSTGAVGALYDALIGMNSYTLQYEGHLSELPTISQDGLTWTFKLKPNLKWSDNAPITADDVIFTLDLLYDEKVQTNMRESMLVDAPDVKGGFKREPLKYRKVDESTIEFKFPAPYAPARSILSFPIAPRHKLLAAYQEGQPGKTRFNATWGVNTSVKELVSSGPWLIESYVPGQRIVYSRNPNYWKKDAEGRPLPYLDHYITLIVPDTNATTLKFRAGETDVLGIQHRDYPLIKREEAKGDYKVMDLGPGWGNSYLSLNLNPDSKVARDKPWLIKLFRDQRFRQAVSHSINRDRICKTVFLGLAQPMYTPESPANTLFFNPDAPKFPYDLAKARNLLSQIGVQDSDGDGVAEYQGHPVRFDIITNVENAQRKAITTIITDDLKKVGLGATFTPINFNSLVGKLDPKPPAPYDWEGLVLGFTGGPEPNDGRNIWQSSGNLHQWHPYQKKPDMPWEAEIDDIFRKGAQTLDQVERKKLYDRWQVVAGEQLPLIYTVVPDGLVALRNKFGNIKPCSLGGVDWNIEEIYDLSATRNNP